MLSFADLSVDAPYGPDTTCFQEPCKSCCCDVHPLGHEDRGLYQPKTATADLTMIPPSGLLRIWRPVAVRKTCSNCSAGGTRDHRVFMCSLPFRLFRTA
jgi:hypothetical protein